MSITVAVSQALFRAQHVSRRQALGAVVAYLNVALLFMGAYIGVLC